MPPYFRYPKDLAPTSSSFHDIVQCHADVYRSCVAYNLGTVQPHDVLLLDCPEH